MSVRTAYACVSVAAMSHLHQGDFSVGSQRVVEHLCGGKGESPPRASLP